MSELLSRVRYVPRHIDHHGGHSGYDRLFEFMGLREARSPTWVRIAGLLPAGVRWRLWALRPQSTQQQGLEAELGALPWLFGGSKRLCHFIYGEDTYFFSPLWKKSTNRIVATFHYPPDRLIERLNPGSLRGLDAVVIVGENQREYFRRYFPDEQIHYCPHHVDTEFFSPTAVPMPPNDPLKMVCVGQLFRDYDALRDVHVTLLREGYPCETHIVGPRSLSEHPIARESKVYVHSNVTDNELRDLYRESTVGVLPLTDATANNALLEMMSTGLPVVTSAIGGIPGYVRNSPVRLVADNDAMAFAEHVKQHFEASSLAKTEGAGNRDYAIRNFGKKATMARMLKIYERVLRA